MFKKLSLSLVSLFLFISLGFAGGIQSPVPVTIGADATYDPIAITSATTGRYFVIEARTDVDWYLAKSASPGENYKTIKAGTAYEFSFATEFQGPYTFGYGRSSSGSLVIEILPFDERP